MSNRIARVILGALVVAVVALAAWGVANAAPSKQTSATETPIASTPSAAAASVPTSSAPTSDIGVSGTGKVYGDPDTAIASVGVDITGPTLAAATSDASTKMKAVLDKIKSLGVDAKDITTVNYNVNPITSNPKEGEVPRITGYHVSNVVQIKIRKLDNVGTILDAAMTAGANSLNGLYFTIDDPSTLMQQARTQAVKDAMAKAKTLADAAGVKLGSITSLTENVSPVRPVYAKADAVFAMPSAANGMGPVESGQTEISVTVELHYQIAQ